MPVTRREFLSEAARAAAMTGLGPGLAAIVSAAGQSSRPYLDLAIRCAKWIDASTQRTAAGLAWPADPLKPESVSLDYYNGTPGVVAFFAQMWQATGDAKWVDLAQQGYDYLIAESARVGDSLDSGLYTGLAGLGATYFTLSALKVGPEFGSAAKQVTKDLVRRAKSIGDGAEWSASNDIISGTAGTGLFLLDAADRLKDAGLADLAMRAGRRLLATGIPAEGGLMWLPGGSIRANYPNFSHGTSGVAYFLATLYQRSKDRAFLDGALAGVKYLDAVATRRNGARAIFHVTGGGEDRFYLSWCHGPVGTARLFYRLLQITGDPAVAHVDRRAHRVARRERRARAAVRRLLEQHLAVLRQRRHRAVHDRSHASLSTTNRREPARSRCQEHDVAREGRCGGIAMGAGGKPRAVGISSRRRVHARRGRRRDVLSAARRAVSRRGVVRALAGHAVATIAVIV